MSAMQETDTDVDARSRGWILVALMFAMMLAAMDTTIVSTAIPQIVDDLGGFARITWVFSIYLLAQTVTIPIYGNLADMFGRKPVLVVGTLVFLAGSAACALAWSMVSLIVFRGLQGLGAGSIMATVNTVAGDLYSVRERARVQGWLSSVWGVAAVAGPLLGGTFAEHATWRWIFLINLPIGAAALGLLVRFLHEKPRHRAHRIDYAGSVLILCTGCVLIFGLLQGGQAWPWLSAPGVGIFALAAGLIVATVWVERRAAEPIMPAWLWRDRVLAGTNLSMIGMGAVLMGPNVYLPTYGQSVLGLGAIVAGFVLASLSIGWPLASALSGPVYSRIGFRDAGLAGGALMTAAAFAFLALPDSPSVWLLVLDQVVLGAGFGLLSTPLLVGVQSTVGWDRRGTVTGANIFSRYLGQTLGAALFGAIFNSALRERLTGASPDLRAQLPQHVDEVIDALHGAHLSAPAQQYLREAIGAATAHVYVGLSAIAVLTLLVLLVAPRRFRLADT
ncbi:MAG: MFS transporter [Burkholderiaceae bacterium]|nr:MFS transporter [Burkholderiaceae bacterium]